MAGCECESLETTVMPAGTHGSRATGRSFDPGTVAAAGSMLLIATILVVTLSGTALGWDGARAEPSTSTSTSSSTSSSTPSSTSSSTSSSASATSDPWAKLRTSDWGLLLVAAIGVGVSKSGLSGIGMVHVLIFAFVFGGRVSTGILLPLLIVGDLCAVRLVGRDVLWMNVRRLLPPALVGVAVGWLLLGRLEEQSFKPLIGGIILALSVGQLARMWRPELFARVPHTTWFVWLMGTLAGVTTMLANAAGPIVALYLLAIALPKTQLVATAAWFFLIVNCVKVPLSANLGLIGPTTLAINLMLAPCVVLGLIMGRWIVARIPQRAFDSLILAFTAAGALRLSGLI
jgi:uncharacterized protein